MPFCSYKSTDDRSWSICCSLLAAESTGFGPERLRCSVWPLLPIEHGWVSGHVLTYSLFGPVYVTRVEPLNQGVAKASYDSLLWTFELNLDVKIVACRHGDQAADVRMSTWPLTQPCSIGNKGQTLHRSLSGPKPVDSAAKRLQHMDQLRSSVLL